MLSIWTTSTSVEKKGGAVVMTLDGAAQDTVFELETAGIHVEGVLDKEIAKLDNHYLKDATLEKFETLGVI